MTYNIEKNKNSSKETFKNSNNYFDDQKKQSTGYYIYALFMFFLWGIAIFLSIRCNGGFDFGAFIAACCCTPFYIIYKLATMPKDVIQLCNNIPLK